MLIKNALIQTRDQMYLQVEESIIHETLMKLYEENIIGGIIPEGSRLNFCYSCGIWVCNECYESELQYCKYCKGSLGI